MFKKCLAPLLEFLLFYIGIIWYSPGAGGWYQIFVKKAESDVNQTSPRLEIAFRGRFLACHIIVLSFERSLLQTATFSQVVPSVPHTIHSGLQHVAQETVWLGRINVGSRCQPNVLVSSSRWKQNKFLYSVKFSNTCFPPECRATGDKTVTFSQVLPSVPHTIHSGL